MLVHPILDKLQILRFFGMLSALEEQMKMPDIEKLSFEDRFGLLVDRETADRQNRRFKTRLRKAKLRQNACIEDIDFRHQRGLDKSLIMQLASCQWIKEANLKTIAQRSIAWRLGIPFNYLAKCPSELQATQMNHWIEHEKNDQLFVRFDNSDVRAIFTPRYKPVDNFEILTRLDDMGYDPDTQVQCHLDGEFMLLSIPDGKQTFQVNGDKMTPGISVSNSEVGLASLSVSAFFLRLVCTNGMVAKTEISASYRHVSTKILVELPQVFEKVSYELGNQRDRFRLSLESPVEDPLATFDRFNKQFQLKESEREAVAWAWPQEAGDTMFAVVNTYTKASQMKGLPAESSYRLQKVGGEVLGMLN